MFGKLLPSKSNVKLEFSYQEEALTRTIKSENRFPGEILIPSKNASFGIIRDIDDTILHTGLTSVLKWRVLINTLLTSAGKRLPLEGVKEFYHLLHQGKTGHEDHEQSWPYGNFRRWCKRRSAGHCRPSLKMVWTATIVAISPAPMQGFWKTRAARYA